MRINVVQKKELIPGVKICISTSDTTGISACVRRIAHVYTFLLF